MDYEQFKARIRGYVVVPDEAQIANLLEAEDTIHFAVTILPFTKNSQKLRQEFCDTVFELEERGAVFPKDFIVTVFVPKSDKNIIQAAVHTKREFLSDEDFDPSYKRYGKKNNENTLSFNLVSAFNVPIFRTCHA